MKYFDEIIRPRYAETDQMGVIYHGNYFTYFEVGRSSFFRQLGYAYSKLEQEGIILPVIECNCKYIKPVMYDRETIIRTQIKELKGIRITLGYQLIDKETETILAEGYTKHAFVGKDLKPVRYKTLSLEFRQVMDELMEGQNA